MTQDSNSSFSMDLSRFTQIVSAYGGQPKYWPVEEREAAAAFMENSEQAQALVKLEQNLDAQLATYLPGRADVRELKSGIIASIEKDAMSILDTVLDWILPENPIQFWRPALVATLPLVIGIMAGVMAQSEPDYLWEDEIALMGLDTTEFMND